MSSEPAHLKKNEILSAGQQQKTNKNSKRQHVIDPVHRKGMKQNIYEPSFTKYIYTYNCSKHACPSKHSTLLWTRTVVR